MNRKTKDERFQTEYVGAVHYAPDGKTILIKLTEINHA